MLVYGREGALNESRGFSEIRPAEAHKPAPSNRRRLASKTCQPPNRIPMTLPLLAAISVPICLLAGLMAFIITYDEYQKHGFRGKRLLGEAFKAAIFAFLVMSALTLLAGLFLRK